MGEPNPWRMLARMPHRVFRQWIQFYNEEPFGAEADGVRLGYAAAALGNLLGQPKGRRSWKPEDFMPDFKPQAPKTPEQQIEHLKTITKMMGGEIIDKRSNGESD